MEFGLTFYLVAALIVFLTGISKAGFGAGVEMMAVPVMALFISPVAAAGIMLPILLSIDAANLWRYRADWQRSMVFVLLPAAVVGITIGTLTFQFLSQDWIRFGLGVLTLSFVAHRLLLPSGDAGSRFSRPFTVALAWFPFLRIVKAGDIPSLFGDLRDAVYSVFQVFPELIHYASFSVINIV